MCLAVPGLVLSIDESDSLLRPARVRFGAIERDVSLACVEEARPGDYVLVHVGFAISVVDPVEAERTLAFLQDAGESTEGAA
jgi:hydrogenase expression/formation protein HypC